jgi:PHP family Zn ribbon phosphoesterase
LFELKELTYNNLIKALRTKQGLTGTIEVDPAYGKYHEDGHRNCNVCLTPKESKKLNNICPKCGKPLTIGVHHRVEELADRPEGFRPKDAKDFKRLIPLSEILSKLLGTGIATKKVWAEFNKLIDHFKSELNILLEAKEEDLKKITDEKIVNAILKNRQGKIEVQPGYDGEYGIPIFSEKDRKEMPKIEIKQKQTGLGEFI